jgi:hypothetical protein
MCLWEFSWNFCDFLSIFRAFKQFPEFIWNCFRIKINFKKNKQTLLNWAEPEGPTQVRAGPAVGPCRAHLRPAQAHRLVCPWRTRRRRRPFPPWRERPGVLGGPHYYLMRARAPSATRVPCALVRHRLRKPPPPVLSSPLLPVLSSPPLPTICHFHRPPSRASTTKSSRPSRYISSAPHRHLLNTGAPPPLADRAGRHGWPSPAACRRFPS